MTQLRIVPYKMGSESARALARELNCLRVYHNSATYRPRFDHVIINWGLSVIPTWAGRCSRIINNPRAVAITSNKRDAFRMYRQRPVPVESFNMPESTEDHLMARRWVERGDVVYCRTVLTGHSGRGIVLAKAVDELVYAPLYTKQFKAKKEFRCHVFQGRVIDEVKKGRRRDITLEQLGREIRNHENGYIFIRQGIEVPQEVREAAIAAVAFYGLDFGAVDVGWHPERGACVYEINTAAGFTDDSTTCRSYARAFRTLL